MLSLTLGENIDCTRLNIDRHGSQANSRELDLAGFAGGPVGLGLQKPVRVGDRAVAIWNQVQHREAVEPVI